MNASERKEELVSELTSSITATIVDEEMNNSEYSLESVENLTISSLHVSTTATTGR